MKSRYNFKEILTSGVFIGIIGVLFIIRLLLPPPEILEAERRVPARFPELSFDTVLSGAFTDRFEDWAVDTFVFRDAFRAVNAFLVFDIYRQSDKTGFYRSDNAGLGKFRNIDSDTLLEAAQGINSTAGIFDGLDMRIYYSIIPDKSIYAEKYLPGFDTGRAEALFSEILTEFKYIDIKDTLNADSYYRTDLHWNQIKIQDTANRLLSQMGAFAGTDAQSSNPNMGAMAQAGEFRGVYAGEYAPRTETDMMSYKDIQGLRVKYLSERTLEMEDGVLYDFSRFAGIDPYDFFLQGPQPLVIIENDNAPERELYMFRDSFGSSLAPLMSEAYSRIILIDMRYIHMSMVDRYAGFKHGSDVLFIYSSQILGNPGVLQG